MNKWPRMIIVNLRPYALRYVNDVANATPNKGEDVTPLEKFSSVSVAPKIRHFHSFRCPDYLLDNTLQSGQGHPKWSSRSRLGVYLRASPNHARSVALILNPRTGHDSPSSMSSLMIFSKPSRLSPRPLINQTQNGSIWVVLQSARRRRSKGKLPDLLIILKGVFLSLLLPLCLKSNSWTFFRLWKA